METDIAFETNKHVSTSVYVLFAKVPITPQDIRYING